jgi:hypothetical protein
MQQLSIQLHSMVGLNDAAQAHLVSRHIIIIIITHDVAMI